MAGWLDLAGWLAGAGCLPGWLPGWLAGGLAGCLAGWLACASFGIVFVDSSTKMDASLINLVLDPRALGWLAGLGL